MRTQRPRDDIPKKIYSLHAPEVECIGKGMAHKPYEFGVKVSVATTLNRSKGGQFAVHAKALPGRPYDGHTLQTILPEIEQFTGAALQRILADAGYKGHKRRTATQVHGLHLRPEAPHDTQHQAPDETPGCCRTGHWTHQVRPQNGRNFLAHIQGDAVNPILAAAGYNFRLILKWIRLLWLQICWMLMFNQSAKIA